MITRWASWGAATVLAVSLLVAPRLAVAQGITGSAAVGNGVANPLGLD